MATFKEPVMQKLFEGCRKAASDNWSEMYHASTTAGPNPMGPNPPRRGAGLRCAYWDGRQGINSLYSRDRKIMGYAAFKAGAADRHDDLRR